MCVPQVPGHNICVICEFVSDAFNKGREEAAVLSFKLY